MGDVIDVKFGIERLQEEFQSSLTPQYQALLEQWAPDRMDRAPLLAQAVVMRVREIAECRPVVKVSVALPVESPEALRKAFEEVVEQVATELRTQAQQVAGRLAIDVLRILTKAD